MKIVFFDLETGGLRDCSPDIQLAAIAVEDWTEIDVYETKIQFDERNADRKALEINHYDPETWRHEALPESQVVEEFGVFLRRHADLSMVSRKGKPYTVARLAGHNAVSFDAPRLQRMYKRHGAFLPAMIFQPLDTLQRALWYFYEVGIMPKSYKLADLCVNFGIQIDGAHDALTDVRMTARLAAALCKQRFAVQGGEKT